ncbi:PilZ domain-containing protein [uncultured Marinobacter sp.]|uniref:PilZ domain-containing protein n=1 Tax=uncultured Marinobacter sp. TaxID=187379 RepID=UPI0030DCCDA9
MDAQDTLPAFLQLLTTPLDVLLGLFILFLFCNKRFNKWPKTESLNFSGQPEDYIDQKRYSTFRLIYFLSFSIYSLALFLVPDLLKVLFPAFDNPLLEASADYQYFSLSAALAIGTLKISTVQNRDEEWRKNLHDWARIPRAVEDVMHQILINNKITINSHYERELKVIISEKLSGPNKTFWLGAFEKWSDQTEENSVHLPTVHDLIFCFYCLKIVKELSPAHIFIKDIKDIEDKIENIANILPSQFGSASEKQTDDELGKIKQYLTECICRHIIKTYSNPRDQYDSFSRLGFQVRIRDTPKSINFNIMIYCIISGLFITALTTSFTIISIDRQTEISYFTNARFLTWTSGAFICSCLSMFSGVFFYFNKTLPDLSKYLSAFMFSSLLGFIYFHISTELMNRSDDNVLARMVVSSMYASISLVVLRALEIRTHYKRELIVNTAFNSVALGVFMMIFQILTTIAFDSSAPLVESGLIGFLKGALWGGMITYLIAGSARKSILFGMRSSPRAPEHIVLKIIEGDFSERTITKDISRGGAQIKTQAKFNKGQVINLSSNQLGNLSGEIQWAHRSITGDQHLGIRFLENNDKLKNYLRVKHGEYYAQLTLD